MSNLRCTHKRLSWHALWLLLTVVATPAHAETDAPIPPDENWYQIEVLLFERLNTSEFFIDPPTQTPPVLQPTNWHTLVNTPPLTPNQFQVVPPEENTLRQNYWDKLARSKNLRPIYSTAWKQELINDTPRAPIKIQIESSHSTSNRPVLYQGTLSVRRSRYLHADIDLALVEFNESMLSHFDFTQPSLLQPPPLLIDNLAASQALYPTADLSHSPVSAQQNWALTVFRLKESRKMRSKELHYIDYPQFGLIVIVHPTHMPDYAKEIPQEDLPVLEEMQPLDADQENGATDSATSNSATSNSATAESFTPAPQGAPAAQEE